MDNATLSLLNNSIFWTFLVLGTACMIGSMLAHGKTVPAQPFRNRNRRRYRDEHEEGGF